MGGRSGNSIVHTRCKSSVFDWIEQLYEMVSPGQSISSNFLVKSSSSKAISARRNEASDKTHQISRIVTVKGRNQYYIATLHFSEILKLTNL